MNSKRVQKESKFVRCMRAPLRVLAQARDFYVRSLMGCAGHLSIGNATGFPAPYIPDLPRNFSTNSCYGTSHEDDYRELIRAASTRTRMSNVPRSKSVTIGRIDEHKPFEFAGSPPEVFSRCRSYAGHLQKKKDHGVNSQG